MSKAKIEFYDGESLVIEGFANKIGVWGGPGGKLMLTNQRLIFTNRRQSKLISEYPLESIIHVGLAGSATIWTAALLVTIFIRNAIRVTFQGGDSQRFVVNNRQRWVALIDEHRKSTAPSNRNTLDGNT
ncbi:MAG: hypothetical protein AB7F96_05505 [Beijerinckiaceae bacterium]